MVFDGFASLGRAVCGWELRPKADKNFSCFANFAFNSSKREFARRMVRN